MATDTPVNILELPEVTEITSGDYMLVESADTGTSIINFKNFLISPENTTFQNTLSNVYAFQLELSAGINTAFDTLSAGIDAKYNQLYTGKVSITITSGNSTATGVLQPIPPTDLGTLATTDVILVPANSVAVLSGAYVSGITSTTVGRGTVTITAPNVMSGNATFNAFLIGQY